MNEQTPMEDAAYRRKMMGPSERARLLMASSIGAYADYLLHEERAPGSSASVDAWHRHVDAYAALEDAISAPPPDSGRPQEAEPHVPSGYMEEKDCRACGRPMGDPIHIGLGGVAAPGREGKGGSGPDMKVGIYAISACEIPGFIWIAKEDGEGGAFRIDDFETRVKEFYDEKF